MKFKHYGTVALIALLAAAPAHAGKDTKPLNAGKTGIKSNAGAGDGGEMTLTSTGVVAGTSYTVDSEPVVTNESSLTTATTPIVTTNQISSSTESRTLNNGRTQTRTVTVYEVITTTGTETVTSYDEVVYTQTYVPQTQTDVYVDVDPGNSQKNKSPEISGETVETALDPIAVGEPVPTTTPVTSEPDVQYNDPVTTTETVTGGWGAATN